MYGDDERTPVITGVGLLTSAGASRTASWREIKAGESCLTPPTVVDEQAVAQYSVHVTGNVSDFDTASIDWVDERSMGRYTAFTLAAASEALEDAQLSPDGDAWNAERVGVSVASAFGGLSEVLDEYDTERSKVSSYLAAKSLTNLASGHLSIRVGAKGPNRAQSTACAAGTHALDAAATDLHRGRADVMLVGGTEAILNYYGIAMTAAPRAYTSREGADAVRPFDEIRDGLALGEGAAILVVETEEHARNRGADRYARITGVGATADAHHPVSPPDDGEGLQRSMRMALEESNVAPEDVDYVHTHGTGTAAGDLAEARAVERVIGDDVPLTSIKGTIGHTYGAAGAIDAATAVLSIRDDTIPATANVENVDSEIDPPIITGPTEQSVEVVVSNSAGFGGTNGTVVFEE